MPFRLKFLPLLLLFSCALPAVAEEEMSFALKPSNRLLALPEPDQPTPIFIYADKIEGVQDQRMEATDHVELRKLGQRVWADYLLYLPDTQDIHAKGAVRIEQNNNTLQGPELHMNLGSNVGDIPKPEYILGDVSGHGQADSLHIASRTNYDLENASYTTCPANKEDWLLRAGQLNINQDTQIGEAEDVTVRWLGVPILYSPWMDFPLGDQRKSGFLGPVFGTTSKGGSEITIPYYWNIAPNLDATLSPRVMQKRGVLFNNEFRYLEPGYGGEIHTDVLPNDPYTKNTRTRFHIKHQQLLAPGLVGNLLYNQVSDDAYFRDLSSAVNTATQIYLPRQATLAYAGGGWWSASMNLQRFQILQDPAAPVTIPYYRTPQILLNAMHPLAEGTFKFTGEFVDFSHPTQVNGRRLTLLPSFTYPLATNPGYYLTPKISLHSTTYALGVNNNGQFSSNTTRSIPMFSLDSGLTFERETEVGERHFLQTVEPRAYYVYIPYQDQTTLPMFDTGQLGFSYAQIFTENRFVGNDRVGDANQVTTGLSSRLIDQESGDEWMRFFLGQRFSAITPRVNLLAPTGTTNKSDVLAGLSARATQSWSFDSLVQYNPSTKRDELFNVTARYQPEPGKVANFGYRFMRSTLNQPTNVINHINASGQWPLYGRWDAVARANYSLQQNRLVEGLAGLEYNQDCWTVRLVAQRFAIATQQTSTGFFLQLELNGLVKVGSDPLTALRQGIPGYTKMNQIPTQDPLPNMYN